MSAQGKLFAVGGYGQDDAGEDGDYDSLSSVECFDPSTCVWTNINPMNEARYKLGVAVLGDKLFAIGGMSDPWKGRLSSVECLDLSVPDSAWTPVAPMTMPRCHFGVAVTGGKIYAIAGYNKGNGRDGYNSNDAANSMECFDPNNGPEGRWIRVKLTSTPHNIRASVTPV